MAEVNGSAGETTVKTEPLSEPKVEVNGSGDAVETESKVDVEEKKVDVKDIKAEVKVELDPVTLAKKVKRQIEYYFGDYNLPTDKFLREQVKENDGWVTLETMLKFKRLASLTQDPAVIISALAESQLIQINEDKTSIRRNPEKPLPVESEARRKEILDRSVYVKGFPMENFTVDTALDFFENYGPPDDVVLRYFNDKATKKWLFKGSCFIKYPTKEAAAEFLAIEEVKYNDNPLIKMWQNDYVELKRKERLEMRLSKRKRPHEDEEDNKARVKQEIKSEGLPKNATLHMKKCPQEGMAREEVKERLEKMGVTVAFIDYNKGDEDGYIRLHEADSAPTVLKECEGGLLKVKEGLELELTALEGEEEEQFLQKAQGSINERRAKGSRGRRGGRGGGRGNRGGRGHWKHRRGDRSEEPPAKARRTEGGGD